MAVSSLFVYCELFVQKCDILLGGVQDLWQFVTGGQKSSKIAWHTLWTAPKGVYSPNNLYFHVSDSSHFHTKHKYNVHSPQFYQWRNLRYKV